MYIFKCLPLCPVSLEVLSFNMHPLRMCGLCSFCTVSFIIYSVIFLIVSFSTILASVLPNAPFQTGA